MRKKERERKKEKGNSNRRALNAISAEAATAHAISTAVGHAGATIDIDGCTLPRRVLPSLPPRYSSPESIRASRIADASRIATASTAKFGDSLVRFSITATTMESLIGHLRHSPAGIAADCDRNTALPWKRRVVVSGRHTTPASGPRTGAVPAW